MNKKEIAELRKQYTPQKSSIDRICGCYVDAEKNIKFKMKQAFFSLPEEEEFKYFDLLKKTFSGGLGTNLFSMEFPLEAEEEGGTQEFLYRLRESKLNDEVLLDEFYDRIIANYDYGENYYIILIHCCYDVPGKASDGMEMEDASDTVFEYIHCAICPVGLSKAGLGYNPEENIMSERIRDWVVDRPATGFLFPSFNDRATDLHSVLYYSKNPKEIHPEFIDGVLGSYMAQSSVSQKEAFQNLVIETLEEDCDFDVIKNIHENIQELIELNQDNPDPVTVTKDEMKQIFYDSGASDEKMEDFDLEYEAYAGKDTPLMATNISSPRSFAIETPDITVKVKPERLDLIQTKIIDGRQCLVIAVDSHLQVNGVDVKTFAGIELPGEEVEEENE
ncbi:MAG: DUF4317 domain-containing protein [Lachnospiraceae bacterium]|nr:DUF4317 domain-containing protein [Lachnospiraceae bacterium]